MPSYDGIDWYDTPRYYDIVFQEDTEREARFLEWVRATHGRSRGRRALEPACGSGRLVLALARRGWRVTGFDASEPMLAYARRRIAASPRARSRAAVVPGRMEAVPVRGRYDLAHCLVSTFKYLLDEESARAHLEGVARVLAPGGVYVLGVHLTDYDLRRRLRERWVGRRGTTEVVCNLQSWPPDRRARTERVRSRLVVREGHGRRRRERRTETEWLFRTYDAKELRASVEAVRDLEHVATYGFDYEPGWEKELVDDAFDVVLVLRRR